MKRLLLLLLGLLLATAPYLQAQDDNPDATSEVALVGIAPNEGKYYLFDAANEVIQEDTLMGDELSRFLSVDPLRHAYPMLTPYQFASNTPIVAIDLDGLEALKASDYATLEELKTELKIQYYSDERTELVTVSHTYGGVTVTNQLEEQVTEKELAEAMQGSGWDRFVLGVQHPYLAWTPLEEALTLSMRGANETGVAFWDIAINMYSNISSKDKKNFSKADKNAKIGYMNTFLHVIGQAFLTTLFSKGSADRLGDIHENSEPREMRTGVITTEDLRDKAINTYVDLANNSWGQVLGAGLREKYGITKETTWTPQLTANYLNDIQKNMSDTHCIQFKPFKPYQNVILKFTRVLNSINTDEKDEKKGK